MPQDTTNNMMDNYFNSDPTDFEETPFHLITTDHPYMATLGLSTFTTGTLYRWWNKKDGQGDYKNHKHFSTVTYDESPHDLLLGTDTDSNTDKSSDIGKGQFAFQAWRKEGDSGAGQYIDAYIDEGHTKEWIFSQNGNNEAGNPRSYTYADLELSLYNDSWFEHGVTMGGTFEIPDGQGGQEEVDLLGINPITNIITINDKVNHQELETIDKSTWTQEEFARAEFVLDIQASKGGYVEWSGYVPFQINLHDGDDTEFKCDKPEWVKFRLYLHPNSAPKSTRRGIAMSKPTFAAPPVDSLGRKYQFKEDGRFSAFPEGSKAAEVVGELDMSFNEYTGKWEAGSKQMVAVVTQPIAAAQVMSSERLRNLSPEEMLRNPNDPNSHIIWGSGAAFPLNMQNGNPMQWTPNYAQSSEVDADGKFSILCPEESDEKANLRVFNASAKELEVDQYVLLNQIDGLWFAIDFPSGVPGDAAADAGFDGLWEFSYCATNVCHYFRTQLNDLMDSHDIEKGLHRKYYVHDPINSGTYLPGDEKMKQGLLGGGYHQMSSFDMMDNLIGGTRNTGQTNSNAYGITNPVVGPNGENVESDHNGYATGTFFGCIFPDGYDGEGISKYRSDRTYIAKPTTAVSGLVDGKWKSKSTHSTVGPSNFQYFHTGGIAKDGRPFNDGPARHDYKGGFKDGEGDAAQIVPMFSDSDTSLSQLPADIALNASPLNPENGQPLTNLHLISAIYHSSTGVSDNPGYNFKERIREVFSAGKNWIYKRYDDDDDSVGIKDFMESSAFDLKPKRVNRIMFRPLKVEAYAQFGSVEYDQTAEIHTRQGFNQIAAGNMHSAKRPASDISRNRELERDIDYTTLFPSTYQGDKYAAPFSVPNLMGNIYHLYNSRWGLQHNIDIPTTPGWNANYFEDGDFKIRTNAQLPVTNGRFHQIAWGFGGLAWNDWMHGNAPVEGNGVNPPWRDQEDPAPAGAFGIIGAVATCTANSKIHFESTCKLGIWSYNFAPAPGQQLEYQPTWGTGDGYRDPMTTNLFVKVYHRWPREQTIYDPRYYAVHHFNAGILDETSTDNPESFLVRTTEEELSVKDPDTGTSKNYLFEIDQSKYEIDIRKPCAKRPFAEINDNGTNRPMTLLGGSKLWGTRSVDENGKLCEALPKSMWNIDTQRRAKLLPYRYVFPTVVIPKVKVTLPSYGAGLDSDGNEQVYKNGGWAVVLTGAKDPDTGVYPHKMVKFYDHTQPDGSRFTKFDPLTNPDTEDVVMIIKNPGVGGATKKYKVGDTFVTPAKLGSQAMIKVMAVEGGGLPSDEGRIESFEFVLDGYDFGNEGFTTVEEGKPITHNSTGMSLSSGGSQPSEDGIGFECVLVRGEVGWIYRIDEKPLIATATESNRISIKSEKGGTAEAGEPMFGLIQDTYELDLEIENASIDSKYDLFFHFHNDISMTFMTNQNAVGAVGPPINDEQYIDLTITTT